MKRIFTVVALALILCFATVSPALASPNHRVGFRLEAGGTVLWTNFTDDGETLAHDATVTWTNGSNQYQVTIPAGTQITAAYGQPIAFYVTVYNNRLYANSIPAYMSFSPPVTVSQIVNGQPITLASFTSLAGATLIPLSPSH